MSRARNLNDPQHWLAWLKACQKDEWSSKRLRLPGSFGMLTGQDMRALSAIAHCWALYARSDENGAAGAIVAVRALLPALQPECRGFARELIPQAMDWGDRERVWDRVMDGWLDEIHTAAMKLAARLETAGARAPLETLRSELTQSRAEGE
jgi:hypothetical protein